MTHRLTFLVAALVATGCGAAPATQAAPPPVPSELATAGESIYFGSVYPLDGEATKPTYVYERRVDARNGALVSSHITRDSAGRVVLAESAKHSADYTLEEYALHRNQLGQTGTVRVVRDEVTFHRVDADGETSAIEHQTDPVVVGPTLVGYIVRHLDALRAGAVLPVRMAVLDRLETIGFELDVVDAAPGQTRVRMSPSSVFVGLVVDPIDFTFDATTGNLVRLEGRVPTKVRDGDDWADFDARVEYRFVAAVYR